MEKINGINLQLRNSQKNGKWRSYKFNYMKGEGMVYIPRYGRKMEILYNTPSPQLDYKITYYKFPVNPHHNPTRLQIIISTNHQTKTI